MTGAEIGVLISVIGNLVLGVWGFFKKRAAKKASDHLDTALQGLERIEDAIEKNKGVIEKTDIGRKITKTIKEYGPIAESVVDEARKLLHTFGW